GCRWDVGGSFVSLNGQTRHYLAAMDAVSGNVLPWDPEPDSYVGNMATDGSRILVTGGFFHIGGAARRGFAAVDASTGAVDSFDAGLDDGAYGVSLGGADLFLTGVFHSCRHVAAPRPRPRSRTRLCRRGPCSRLRPFRPTLRPSCALRFPRPAA